MNDPLLEFVPSVFFKVLGATLTVVLVGWVGALWLYGGLRNVDMIGSLICVPIFAYMVHLWIVYARERETDE